MSIKYIYIYVVIFFTTTSLSAQHKISGYIKDKKTNETLSNVSVYINDLKLGVSSDLSGNYEIKNLKSGNYSIEVGSQDYNSVVYNINITKDSSINFELSTSHREISEVIITGVSRSTEIKQNPVIIKSIDKNFDGNVNKE